MAALQNCAVRYANSDDEAAYLAPKLRTTAENLRSLPVGTFAAYVRDIGALNLRVPHFDLSQLDQMTEDEQVEHRAQMIYDYCIFPEQQEAPEPQKSEPVTPQKAPEHSDTNTLIDRDNISTEPSKKW